MLRSPGSKDLCEFPADLKADPATEEAAMNLKNPTVDENEMVEV